MEKETKLHAINSEGSYIPQGKRSQTKCIIAAMNFSSKSWKLVICCDKTKTNILKTYYNKDRCYFLFLVLEWNNFHCTLIKVMYGCESRTMKSLSTKVLMLLNYGAREDSWESLEQKRDQTSQYYRKSTLTIHWKDWMLKLHAKAEVLILWPPDAKSQLILKRPWCWERLKAWETGDRGWDGWIAPLT